MPIPTRVAAIALLCTCAPARDEPEATFPCEATECGVDTQYCKLSIPEGSRVPFEGTCEEIPPECDDTPVCPCVAMCSLLPEPPLQHCEELEEGGVLVRCTTA